MLLSSLGSISVAVYFRKRAAALNLLIAAPYVDLAIMIIVVNSVGTTESAVTHPDQVHIYTWR
jgi:hypothetical protein